jgi:hypothetical protein
MSLKDILCPSVYTPTEQEHRVAYLNCVLETIVYDYLLSIQMIKDGKMKDDMREKDGIKSYSKYELDNLLKGLFEKWGDSEKEAWENLVDYDKFKQSMIENLSDFHCGDCISAPMTCVRCHAEDSYGIKNTVTWETPREGYKLNAQYSKELENKNE